MAYRITPGSVGGGQPSAPYIPDNEAEFSGKHVREQRGRRRGPPPVPVLHDELDPNKLREVQPQLADLHTLRADHANAGFASEARQVSDQLKSTMGNTKDFQWAYALGYIEGYVPEHCRAEFVNQFVTQVNCRQGFSVAFDNLTSLLTSYMGGFSTKAQVQVAVLTALIAIEKFEDFDETAMSVSSTARKIYTKVRSQKINPTLPALREAPLTCIKLTHAEMNVAVAGIAEKCFESFNGLNAETGIYNFIYGVFSGLNELEIITRKSDDELELEFTDFWSESCSGMYIPNAKINICAIFTLLGSKLRNKKNELISQGDFILALLKNMFSNDGFRTGESLLIETLREKLKAHYQQARQDKANSELSNPEVFMANIANLWLKVLRQDIDVSEIQHTETPMDIGDNTLAAPITLGTHLGPEHLNQIMTELGSTSIRLRLLGCYLNMDQNAVSSIIDKQDHTDCEEALSNVIIKWLGDAPICDRNWRKVADAMSAAESRIASQRLNAEVDSKCSMQKVLSIADLSEVLKRLRPMASHWQSVGGAFGLSFTEVKQFDKAAKPADQKRDLIHHWLINGNLKGERPTYAHLIDALRNIQSGLASSLNSKYQTR